MWAAACSAGPFFGFLQFAWRLEAAQLHQTLGRLVASTDTHAGAGTAPGGMGDANAGAAAGGEVVVGEVESLLVEHALMAGLTLATASVGLMDLAAVPAADATTGVSPNVSADAPGATAVASAGVANGSRTEVMLEDLRCLIDRLNQQALGYARSTEQAHGGGDPGEGGGGGSGSSASAMEMDDAGAAVVPWPLMLIDTARERAVHLVTALWEAGPTNHARGWSEECVVSILPQVSSDSLWLRPPPLPHPIRTVPPPQLPPLRPHPLSIPAVAVSLFPSGPCC